MLVSFIILSILDTVKYIKTKIVKITKLIANANERFIIDVLLIQKQASLEFLLIFSILLILSLFKLNKMISKKIKNLASIILN